MDFFRFFIIFMVVILLYISSAAFARLVDVIVLFPESAGNKFGTCIGAAPLAARCGYYSTGKMEM